MWKSMLRDENAEVIVVIQHRWKLFYRCGTTIPFPGTQLGYSETHPRASQRRRSSKTHPASQAAAARKIAKAGIVFPLEASEARELKRRLLASRSIPRLLAGLAKLLSQTS